MDKFYYPLTEKTTREYADQWLKIIKSGQSAFLIFAPHAGARGRSKFLLDNPKLFPDIFTPNRLFLFLDSIEVPENSPTGYFYLLGQGLKLNLPLFSQSEEYELFLKCKDIILSWTKNGKEVVIVINDFEQLPKQTEFFNKLKALWQIEKTKIHFFLLGIKTPLDENDNSYSEFSEVIFQNIITIPLPNDDDIDFLIERNCLPKKSSLAFKKMVRDLCGGHPFLIKIACRLKEREKIIQSQEVKIILNDIYNSGYREPFGELYAQFLIEKTKNEPKSIKFNDKNQLVVNDEPAYLSLTPKEYEMLCFFLKHKNELITRDAIAEVLWGKNAFNKYSDWAIDQLISQLRKKIIKFNLNPLTLKTIKGKGYIFKDYEKRS